MREVTVLDRSAVLMKIGNATKRLITTNILWFVYTIPFFIFIYLIFIGNDFSDNILYWASAAVFVPTLFFPATTAMYAVLRKFVMGEEVPIAQSFRKYYQENYLTSLIGGIIITILWIALAFLYGSYADSSQIVQVILLIVAIVLLVFMLNFFAITSHLEMTLMSTIQSAFFITIGSPVLSLVVGIVAYGLIHLSVNMFPFLLIIITGALIAQISFSGFYRLMVSIRAYQNMSKEDDEESDEEKSEGEKVSDDEAGEKNHEANEDSDKNESE